MEQYLPKNLAYIKKITFFLLLLIIFSGCSFLGIKVGKTNKRLKTIAKENLGGVFKSIDRGYNFEQKVKIDEKNNINKINVKQLEFDPQDTLTLYLLSKYKGLWVSYNGAESWERILNKNLEYFALDPKTRGVIYASTGPEIIKTVDGGSYWETIFTDPNGNAIKSIAIDYTNDKRIIALTENAIIFESLDYGDSWSMLNKIITIKKAREIIMNPKNPNEMYITTYKEGVLKTKNGGKSWISLKRLQDFKNAKYINQLKINPIDPSHIYLATKFGILKSFDSGNNWEHIKTLSSPSKSKIKAVSFNIYNEQELYYSDDVSLYKSKDGGKSWIETNLPTTKQVVEILIDDFDTNIVYAGVSNK